MLAGWMWWRSVRHSAARSVRAHPTARVCDNAVQSRPLLLEAMRKEGFVYHTLSGERSFGNEEVGTLCSGVVIVSKHPILKWDFKPFTDAVGDGIAHSALTVHIGYLTIAMPSQMPWPSKV